MARTTSASSATEFRTGVSNYSGANRFDDWRVWGRYAIDDYEPCVKALLRTSYTALRDGSRLYLRNDRLVAPIDREVTPPGPAHLSRPLRTAEPLALMLDPRHLAGGGALTKIGVMLRFAPGQAFGDLELRLRGPGGIDQRARVLVSAADGDAYHYLDLPPARYDAAEIVGVAGDGIRVREGIDGSGRTLSCLSYGYADGRYAFTPGCPLY